MFQHCPGGCTGPGLTTNKFLSYFNYLFIHISFWMCSSWSNWRTWKMWITSSSKTPVGQIPIPSFMNSYDEHSLQLGAIATIMQAISTCGRSMSFYCAHQLSLLIIANCNAKRTVAQFAVLLSNSGTDEISFSHVQRLVYIFDIHSTCLSKSGWWTLGVLGFCIIR